MYLELCIICYANTSWDANQHLVLVASSLNVTRIWKTRLGVVFPSFLSGRLKQTQARGHLRTTGIWPCTSWRARGLVSLQLCVIPSSGLKSCFEILLPLKLMLHIPSTYIYKCTRDLRRWKVWQNNIVHLHALSLTFQQCIEIAYLLCHKVWFTYL